jgi:hypothetical protein
LYTTKVANGSFRPAVLRVHDNILAILQKI